MDICQSSAALQWTYRRPDARVSQCIRDGDVERGLVGVFSRFARTRKVGHLHLQPYDLHIAVELKYLEFVLPAHGDAWTISTIHSHVFQ